MTGILSTYNISSTAKVVCLLVTLGAVASCEQPQADVETTPMKLEDNATLSPDGNETEVLTANSQTTSDPTKFGVHPSIVSSDISEIKQGTPEAILSRALNTMYYGNAKNAAIYYKTSMPDFEAQLENTQEAFQKTVRNVTIKEVVYNDNRTLATLKGEILLNGVEQTDYAEFDLQKIDGVWMLLTD